jgi:hypothetical protein
MRSHEPNTRSAFGPSCESSRRGLAARTPNFYLLRRRILSQTSTAPAAAMARPGIATLGSTSGAATEAKASFELVSATERTTNDSKMRDHFPSMVDLSAFFGVCNARAEHFREEQEAIAKSSLGAMWIRPK